MSGKILGKVTDKIRRTKRSKSIGICISIACLGLISLLILGGFIQLPATIQEQAVSYNVVEDDPDIESTITANYMLKKDLIIEFTNPLDEEVRIDGLKSYRYSIEEDRIVIYDYEYERFRVIIGPASDVYEFGITIITVQSYPTLLGNWTVRFNTTGTANLTITAVDGTEFERDIEFLELRCGDNLLTTKLIDDVVFVENYSCDATGYEISKVMIAGKHTLEFRFGNDVEYAYNEVAPPTYSLNSTNNTVAGRPTEFRLKWTDDAGLSGYIFTIDNGTSPHWYSDTSFPYRNNISINNSQNSNTLTNYQVFVNVSYNSKMQSDFDDLRFTYYNSTDDTETEIDYWIENNVTSNYAETWIEVSSIAANDYETVYIYYGNSTVSSTSNGTEVFYFFADFETGDLNQWSDPGAGCSIETTVVKQGGYAAKCTGGATGRTISQNLSAENKNLTGTFMIDGYFRDTSSLGWAGYPLVPTGSTSRTIYSVVFHYGNFQYYHGSYAAWPANSAYSVNTWYHLELMTNFTGSKQKAWKDGLAMGTIDLKDDQGTTLDSDDSVYRLAIAGGAHGGKDIYIDSYFVRNYTDPEPTTSRGSEEYMFEADNWTTFPTGGTEDWSNVTKVINSTEGATIKWGFYANDTSNNWNASEIFSFVTIIPPLWRNQTTNDTNNMILQGNAITLTAQGYDETALDWALLSTNESGQLKNKTQNYFSPMDMGDTVSTWTWSNFTWSNSSVAEGTIIGWKIYYNDTSGNENVTDINTFSIDITPSLGNLEETPTDPATYASGQSYYFNITVNDRDGVSDISTVLFSWNSGANESVSACTNINSTAKECQVTKTDLAVQSSTPYKWFANDSSNAWVSISDDYTISAGSSLATIAGISNGTYPDTDTIYVTSNVTGGSYMLRNGTNITTENNTAVTLAAGLYNYTGVTNGNASYSGSSTTVWYDISKGDTSCGISPSPQTITYETSITPYCYSNATEVQCTLWRDNVNVTTAENNTATVYGADDSPYTFRSDNTATQNYSACTAATFTLTVNKKAFIFGLSPSTQTITYGTSVTEYATSNDTISASKLSLWRNEVNITNLNGTTETLGYGTWNFKVNSSNPTGNYSWSQQTSTVTVGTATTEINLYFNGTEGDSEYMSTIANITAVSDAAATVKIYSNYTNGLQEIASGTGSVTNITDTDNLALGWYLIKATATGNYTAQVNYTLLVWQNGTVSVNLNATEVGHTDGINVSGQASYVDTGYITLSAVEAKISGSVECTDITDASGSYDCQFGAPNQLGTFTVDVEVTDNITGKVITNSSSFSVTIIYGEEEKERIEAENVGCYEVPKIMQNPDGSINKVTVRICVWE